MIATVVNEVSKIKQRGAYASFVTDVTPDFQGFFEAGLRFLRFAQLSLNVAESRSDWRQRRATGQSPS